MINTKTLVSAAAGVLLLGAVPSSATVVFAQSFAVKGDGPVSFLEWHANVGPDGTIGDDNTDIIAGPYLSGSGYLFNRSDAGVMWMAWTEKADVTAIGDVSKLKSISFRARNSSPTEGIKIVLRVGADWYVSSTEYSNPDANTLERIEIPFDTITWSRLAFVPGANMSEGSAASLPASGAVTAIGFFDYSHSGLANGTRIFDLEVEATLGQGN
jgi:hypothetical protein